MLVLTVLMMMLAVSGHSQLPLLPCPALCPACTSPQCAHLGHAAQQQGGRDGGTAVLAVPCCLCHPPRSTVLLPVAAQHASHVHLMKQRAACGDLCVMCILCLMQLQLSFLSFRDWRPARDALAPIT